MTRDQGAGRSLDLGCQVRGQGVEEGWGCPHSGASSGGRAWLGQLSGRQGGAESEGRGCRGDCAQPDPAPLPTPLPFFRTNEELVAFLSKNRDKNFLKSHGRDNSR